MINAVISTSTTEPTTIRPANLSTNRNKRFLRTLPRKNTPPAPNTIAITTRKWTFNQYLRPEATKGQLNSPPHRNPNHHAPNNTPPTVTQIATATAPNANARLVNTHALQTVLFGVGGSATDCGVF